MQMGEEPMPNGRWKEHEQVVMQMGVRILGSRLRRLALEGSRNGDDGEDVRGIENAGEDEDVSGHEVPEDCNGKDELLSGPD